MRLTLRTLLAYLDDILEPADARDLGQKIEESEFASGLVHRIRSVTRKLRLGAPKLAGKGMGLDANTVAEYLDNTLPQDRVPDFEKVCLESDVHLAEVASCHQILTLVLGEPADVDPALRERIRLLQVRIDGLGDDTEPEVEPRAELTPPASGSVARAEQAEPDDNWEPSPEAPRIKPTAVPELAAPSSIRLMPVLATLVVAFLLALVALIAMGPLDADHPILGRMLAGRSKTPVTASDPGVREAASGRERVEQPDGPAPNVGGPAAGQDVASPQPAVGDEGGGRAADSLEVPLPRPPSEQPGTGSEVPQPAGSGTSDTATIPIPPTETQPPTGVSAGTTMPAEGATEGEPAAEPEPLARCESSLHILARFDPVAADWLRVAANDPIAPEQELVALPTYRPHITFASGVHVMLVGPASVSLREPGADGVAGLIVHYGQILLTTDGSPDTALDVQCGERSSRVTLPALDSSLALDVQRYSQPGLDPEESPAHWLIQAQATAGRFVWRDQGQPEGITMELGQSASMIDVQPPQLSADVPPPDWLDAKNLRPIDRDASERLEPLLALNRPLTTSLLEQTASRLIEVRSLAVRSLCALAVFDSFIIEALNSKTYHIFWPDLILSLRIALAQDPAIATNIRSTFERLRGSDGSQMFRFLWGYSPAQLTDGGAEALVRALGSDSMDVRVLAYENLYRVVEKTNAYQPELEPNRQRRAILNWQRDLEQKQIVHKTPPFEVEE